MENGRELISRLVRCGFTESNATDICQKYASVEDWAALESFIQSAETYHDAGVEDIQITLKFLPRFSLNMHRR